MKNLSGKIFITQKSVLQIFISQIFISRIFIALIGILIFVTSAHAVEDYHTKRFFTGSTLGHIYVNEWKVDKAYESAEKLIKEDPQNKDNRFLMCLALFYKGDYEESIKYIDEGNPDGSDIYGLIKTTYEQTKNFVRRESEHFIVSYLPGKDEILAEGTLSALEGAYKNIGADLGFYPESKILVEIYPTIKAFTAVSTLTKEDIEISGTIALCKFNRLMITSPRVLLRGYRWMLTLSHEYIHYVVYNLSRTNAPIWFHEGIAKYFEDRFDSDTLGAMTPSSENVLSRRLKNDSLVTLKQMHPSMAKLKSGEDVQVAFAEVNTIIGYMVELKGFDSIKEILRLMSEGKEDYQAVKEVFGISLDEFMQNWKSHMLASNLRQIPGMHITGMDVKIKSDENLSEEAIESEELKSHQSKELKEFITLGNLLRDRGRFTAASFEYEKAYEEDPFSVVALTKLAHSYMLLNKTDKALKILKESEKLYPNYVTTIYRIGMIYMAKEDYKKSIKYFNESIKINPFIPSVRENLMHIYESLGKDELGNKQKGILQILQGS
jgi:tetratricopeptide (TPR) repeat protein